MQLEKYLWKGEYYVKGQMGGHKGCGYMLCTGTRGSYWVPKDGGGRLRIGRV
jgi:hypothetical protein